MPISTHVTTSIECKEEQEQGRASESEEKQVGLMSKRKRATWMRGGRGSGGKVRRGQDRV